MAHKQEKLLGHPLVTSFIKQTWKISGRPVYYLNIFIYLILLTFFITYVYLRFDCKLFSTILLCMLQPTIHLLWLTLYLLITLASIICNIDMYCTLLSFCFYTPSPLPLNIYSLSAFFSLKLHISLKAYMHGDMNLESASVCVFRHCHPIIAL